MIENYSSETVEEKLKIPYIEKQNGNILAKKEEYEASMKHYSKSLLGVKYLKDSNDINTPELSEKFEKDIEIPVNLNLALCNIKVKNFQYVIHHASKVLELDPNNCKAYYRRAIGFHYTASVMYDRLMNSTKKQRKI